MEKKIGSLLLLLIILIIIIHPAIAAEDEGDPSVFGIEIEKLLNLGSGMLAAALTAISLAAYRRSGNKRLVFVTLAFLLFSIKGFLTSVEMFGLELAWVDPVASLLNFAILIFFSIGVLRR